MDSNGSIVGNRSLPLDLETDNPELEAELLKAVDGPFTPYSSEEMRSIGKRIIKEKRAK